jgi:cytochrome b561
MDKPTNTSKPEKLDGLTIFLHFGLMVFGTLVWVTSFGAGDYKKMEHFWFSVHKWLGAGTALFVGARLWYGVAGPAQARFADWVPCTRERLQPVIEDLRGLLALKLPDRLPRQGLAGLWEAFGLLVFTWMGATGLFMFLFLTPGQKARGLVRLFKELHELGEWLVPIFLVVHMAAVLLHALAGDHRWRKMVFLRE